MAEDVAQTLLQALADPAPADNSGFVTIESEPTASTQPDAAASGGTHPDVAALSARLEHLEQLRQRDLQQVQGSRAEVQRVQALYEAEQKRTAELLERFTKVLEQRQAPQATDPPLTMAQVIEEVAVNGKRELADRYEQQLRQTAQQQAQQTTPTITREDVAKLLTDSLAQRDTAATVRARLINDVTSQHGDLINDPQLRTHLIQEYTALATDPYIQALYPPDPLGASLVEFGGQTFDLRLVKEAAMAVKQRLGVQQHQRQTQQAQTTTTVTQSGGATNAAPARDENFTVSEDFANVFKDPAIQRALAGGKWGADPRTMLKHAYRYVPDLTKAQWSRGRGGR